MFGRRKIQPPSGPQPRVSTGGPLSLSDRYLERGLDRFQKKDYEAALADLDEAIRNAPDYAELYVTRGLILFEMGRDDEAMEDLAYALSRDPRQWLANYLLGMIACRRENYQLAVEEFSKAQRYAPHRPEIFYARSIAYHELDEMGLAAQDMDSALQVMSSNDKRRGDARKFLSQVKKEKQER
jgi:Flp pilus assembly protein TadD